LDELPKTAVGKIKRNVVRDMHLAQKEDTTA